MDQLAPGTLQLNQPNTDRMMNRYALALAAALPWAFAQAQNTCSAPLPVVAGVVYTVDTVDGTTVPLPVCSSGGTGATAGEWFVYTATSYVTVSVSSDLVQNGNTDTRVQVYSGACDNLMCVGGDDDSGAGLLTVATFNAFAGQSYLIAWDNRYSGLGFDFTLTEQPWDPTAISFTNLSVPTNSCSGCGQAAVDMNNDGYDDVVTVTAANIRVNYQQPDGTFSMVDYPTTNADYTPSWSIAAGDIDANGYLDLLYGGGSGVTFMVATADGSGFVERSGWPDVAGPQSQYVFSQRSNFIDINNDGHLDAFVCHDVQPNVFYLNDGSGALTFNQGGLGDTPDGGNYGSIWIDYNNDHKIDLFIAKCRGSNQAAASIDQMHRNNGDGTYTEVAVSLGLADYHLSWSSAWADFDLDGDLDVLIGSSSMAQGGHKLMRNDGDVFTNVTEGSGFDVFGGTSVEWVAHDFNNDGWVDVLGASSTIHFNNGDMTFTPIVGPASSGAVADLNNDGFLDVLNGGTIRLNTGNDNNWVRINLQGTLSNANGIGARVELTSPLGTQIRDVKSGDGFRHMSFIGAHFGLGTDDVVEQVTVYWPSGQVDVVKGVAVNTATTITESLTTGLQDASGLDLRISPNPAMDRITIAGAEGETILRTRIIDASGKVIAMPAMRHGQLDVSGLAKGSYLLELETGKGLLRERFSKL